MPEGRRTAVSYLKVWAVIGNARGLALGRIRRACQLHGFQVHQLRMRLTSGRCGGGSSSVLAMGKVGGSLGFRATDEPVQRRWEKGLEVTLCTGIHHVQPHILFGVIGKVGTALHIGTSTCLPCPA